MGLRRRINRKGAGILGFIAVVLGAGLVLESELLAAAAFVVGGLIAMPATPPARGVDRSEYVVKFVFAGLVLLGLFLKGPG